METPSWVPADVDMDRPNPARMYDYYLGGNHNFAVDRAMAERGVALWPLLPTIMRANRAFLTRAVRYLAGQGIDQFVDFGSGIPTVGNVHEIAHAVNPAARVVYIDIDPVVIAHSRAILAADDRALVVHDDVRRYAEILADPAVRARVDLDRPLAVLLVGLLHFIPDADDPAGILRGLYDLVASGSYLALSHFANEGEREQVEGLQRLSNTTPTPLTLRSRREITDLLGPWQLVEPGVVYLPEWRPGADEHEPHPDRFNDFAVVAAKP